MGVWNSFLHVALYLSSYVFPTLRCRAKREHLKRFDKFPPESQGQHMAWSVSYIPYSFDSGPPPTLDAEPSNAAVVVSGLLMQEGWKEAMA
jgi:hypothetical protein